MVTFNIIVLSTDLVSSIQTTTNKMLDTCSSLPHVTSILRYLHELCRTQYKSNSSCICSNLLLYFLYTQVQMFDLSTNLHVLHKIIRSDCSHVRRCWPQQLAYKNSDIHRAGQRNKSLNMFATNSEVAFFIQFFLTTVKWL